MSLQIAGAVVLVALVAVLARLPAHACCYRYMDAAPNAKGLHLREWHHGWLVVLAFIPWLPVQIPALVIGLDDLIGNHLRQFKNPQARSPLHHLARVTWYRWREK